MYLIRISVHNLASPFSSYFQNGNTGFECRFYNLSLAYDPAAIVKVTNITLRFIEKNVENGLSPLSDIL